MRGTYDDQDRMLTYGARKYSYTASGDRLQRYVETNPRKVEYEYNSLGALSKAVRTGYDATTQVSAVDTFEYLNDGLGRRLEKRKNGLLKERYMYDESGQLMAELDANGKIISYFIYATRSHVPDYMVRAKAKFKLIHDHLGSVRMVVNIATGAVQSSMEYDEFGRFEEPPTAVAFQPFGFAGGIYDSTVGLVRFGARDYDPLVGRWTSKDPILFEGGDSNLYGYVLQDPINYIDPSGLANSAANDFTYSPGAGATIGSPLVLPWFLNENKRPLQGPPNGTIETPKGDKRHYDDKGNPLRDEDWSHDRGHGRPHIHDWTPDGIRGPGRPPKPGECK